jgi:homoserine kinase
VAGLVAGLTSGDYDLIGRSLQDVIIEPIRSILIPGFAEIKNAALESGALGCSISGSGPSIFAFSKSKNIAEKAGSEMSRILKSLKLNGDLYISKINKEGPKVIG